MERETTGIVVLLSLIAIVIIGILLRRRKPRKRTAIRYGTTTVYAGTLDSSTDSHHTSGFGHDGHHGDYSGHDFGGVGGDFGGIDSSGTD